MLENLYTTKMSADKKTLQNRLTKICSKNGRFSRLSAAVISCAVAAVMLVATVVIAAGFNRGKNAVPEHEAAETPQVAEFSPADINDIKNVELFAGDVRYTLKTTGTQFYSQRTAAKRALLRLRLTPVQYSKAAANTINTAMRIIQRFLDISGLT